MSRLLTMPLEKTFFIIFGACVLWIIAGWILQTISQKKDMPNLSIIRRAANAAAFAAVILVILHYTLFSRTPFSERRYYFLPFNTLRLAFETGEYKREKLLNVFGYIPVGVTAFGTLSDKVRRPLKYAVLTGLAISTLSELVQFIGKLGFSETDDVIVNTLGAFIGAILYLTVNKILAAVIKYIEIKKVKKKL